MLSIIIPALNEKYLQKTIENVLENSEGDIEIIAICDGYWPSPPILDDPCVRILHNTIPRGQRHSINDGARIARGDIIGKLDAHCAVGKGFDVIIERDMQDRVIMIPEMYNLDIETWKPKFFDDYKNGIWKGKINPYMYIGMEDGNLRAKYYSSKKGRQMMLDKENIKIDETMCCMGPGWFLKKDFFDEIGGCDEEHGHWGQQGVEMACKAWLSGGKMLVNKNTWFAHWFRGSYIHEDGRKGWPYHITQREIDRARRYSNDIWLNNKWDKQTRTFQWLLNKFEPPKWEGRHEVANVEGLSSKRMEMFSTMYKHIHHRKHDSLWKGITLWKFPTDVALYHEAIWETKPDTIVEIGTACGGSAIYFQDMLDLLGNGGKVITIDIRDRLTQDRDPRITYIIGDSTKKEVAEQVKNLVHGKAMVTIDGDHNRIAVKWDLHNYAPLVTKGQYLVVEDCYIDKGKFGPCEAKEWFLQNYGGFEQTNKCERYMIGMTMTGWLKKL